MDQKKILQNIGFGQAGIYFAHGMRRSEIFFLANDSLKALKEPRVLKVDFNKPISELIDNFKKQLEDAFEVQIDQKHYLYAKEQSSPEAFYMMICEVLLLDDLAHDNKIIFIDVPENIFQKDLVAYTKGKEAKDFHFFMNFLGYLVNLSCKNLSIFVSLQSLYAVEFIKSSPASQHRIQSIVLL